MPELTEERVREIVKEEINKYMRGKSMPTVYFPWYDETKKKGENTKKA